MGNKSLISNKNSNYKILMIAPTPFFADRGCHVKILEEIKVLTKRGSKVVLVTYHIGRDLEGIDIRRILKIPWYNKLEAGPSVHKYYLDIILALKALTIAIKFKPDIIHAHLHEGVFVGKLIKLFIKKPLVADYQGSMTAEMLDHGFFSKNSLAFKLNFLLEKIINKWPDKIIFSSSKASEYFLETFDVDPKKVVTFIEGTNTDEFHPNYNVDDLRKGLNLPKNKKIVVYLGVLTKYQGIDILIESIPDIIKKYSNVHFLIAGYPNVDYYKKMAKDLGILDHITFTGKVKHQNAPKYLCLGDIGVSLKLSKTEANGKLFGYMAVGLPCVVFDSPTNREILGDVGIYANYGDKKSFIDKITYLLNNDKIAKKLGNLSRKRVIDNFTWDKTFSNFLPIYQELLTNSK